MQQPNLISFVGPNSKPGGEDNVDSALRKLDANFTSLYGKVLTATASLNFPSTIAGAIADLTISVPGAVLGDTVLLGIPHGSVTATGVFVAWVSAADTVTVRFSPKGTEDPPAGTFKVTVIQL